MKEETSQTLWSFLAPASGPAAAAMLMPKNRISIYELLLTEGVVNKDVHMPKQTGLEDKNTRNLHVMKASSPEATAGSSWPGDTATGASPTRASSASAITCTCRPRSCPPPCAAASRHPWASAIRPGGERPAGLTQEKPADTECCVPWCWRESRGCGWLSNRIPV